MPYIFVPHRPAVQQMLQEIYALMRNPPSEKVWALFNDRLLIDTFTGCWIWQSKFDSTRNGLQGHGQFRFNGRMSTVNAAWAWWLYGIKSGNYKGSDGIVMDHFVCSNPPCANPTHLLPVTPRFNSIREGSKSCARINARKTHCIHGHEFTPENTYRQSSGGRGCITCNRYNSNSAYQRSKRAVQSAINGARSSGRPKKA